MGSSAGANDILAVIYDAAGQRVIESNGSTTRSYLGPYLSHEVSGGTQYRRLDIRAFGETIAYVVRDRTPSSGAVAPPALPGDVPTWLFALVPLAALGWGFGLAIRGGLLVGIARRPATAALSGTLIVALIVVPYPYPALAGGGGWVTKNYTRFVISDAIGSAVAVFEENGVLLHSMRYKPFGGKDGDGYQAPGAYSDPQQRHVFADHAHQDDTGLVYMNARWQDPETGMFLSIDPLVANIADPQSYNAYSYARNNPVQYSDPTGMACDNTTAPGRCDPNVEVIRVEGTGGYGANGSWNGFDPQLEGGGDGLAPWDALNLYTGYPTYLAARTFEDGIETLHVRPIGDSSSSAESQGSQGDLSGLAEFYPSGPDPTAAEGKAAYDAAIRNLKADPKKVKYDSGFGVGYYNAKGDLVKAQGFPTRAEQALQLKRANTGPIKGYTNNKTGNSVVSVVFRNAAIPGGMLDNAGNPRLFSTPVEAMEYAIEHELGHQGCPSCSEADVDRGIP